MENVVKEFGLVLHIDFNLLKEQKKELIKIMNTKNSQKEFEAIEGIINLITHIQDHAVEELGIDENLIFDLENESSS